MARVSIFLITVALIAGMVGCGDTTPTVEIRDWHDLDAIRYDLGKSYRLMNDLDSTTAGYEELASPTANGGKGWQPIGTIGTYGDRFTGTFDGHGYEIRDLFIDRPDENLVGLFSFVGEGGVVEDIGVVNVAVTGNYTVGGLVGWNLGPVSNSYSNGNVTGNYGVGGLVGRSWGTVSNSYSTASVTGDSSVGGLVGADSAGAGTVSKSYSTGIVTGNSYVGGLVGANAGTSTVSDSFWDTETSGQATSAGGTGKTTAEMRDIDTFTAWDIIAVANPGTCNPSYTWNIVDDVTYPFLSWQS
jgi:hypothetical protein